MTIQTILFHFLFALALLGQEPAETRSPDGSQWLLAVREVGTGPEAGHSEYERQEILYFHNGTLRSRLLARRGFAPPAYRSSTDEGGQRIEARATNPANQELTWSGAIEGDTISGTIVVSETPSRTIEFAYRGMRSPTLEGTRWLMTLATTDVESGVTLPPLGVRISFWNGLATTNRESGGVEFQPGLYRMSMEGDEWALEIQQESIEGQRRLWRAVIDGDRMFGSSQRRTPVGSVIAYDLIGRLVPVLEGTTWDLTLTRESDRSAESIALVFEGGRADVANLFGSSLPPGSFQLSWVDTRWRLVIAQLDGTASRVWDGWLEDDRLEGRVVQTVRGEETAADFTGSRRSR